jgi:hypothetical protein
MNSQAAYSAFDRVEVNNRKKIWSMDNASLSLLEVALERERRTMKRQELLRRIWIAHRSSEHKTSEPSRPIRSKMLGSRPATASP